MSVRVFVANDHEILRGALRAVIDMQPDMDVVGEAATGPDAELGIRETEPDVVLMDISIPNVGGRDAIASVKRIRSNTRIVVLAFQEELGYIQAAVRRRAAGYVVKRALNTDLLTAIREVAQGEILADASIRLDSVQGATRSGPPVRCSRALRARPTRA
jgi:DNA-binding NarL/FixJ family response regulator